MHIDSHKLRLRREMMVLADTVRETAARLAPLAKKRGQQIVVHIQDECEMFADPGKLAQVCYNIIENAIKYTPDGGTITVRSPRPGATRCLKSPTRAWESPKRICRMCSTDSTGWTRRVPARRRNGARPVHRQQIVRLHAGTVTVASEYGKGTTFTVQLPVK